MSQRQQYWGLVFLWVGLIYATLELVRPICNFLRERTPFASLVNILIITILVVLIGTCLLKVKPKLTTILLLGFVVLAYSYGLWSLSIAEEKIHFIQYGFLAFLTFRALKVDFNDLVSYGGALFLTFILGWIDEGIQLMLPNRFYDTRDVILNAISGFLALLLVFVFRGELANKQ